VNDAIPLADAIEVQLGQLEVGPDDIEVDGASGRVVVRGEG
jgi:hypothetical protein